MTSPSLTALQGGMGSNRKGDLPTETVPTNVADILTAAADLLEPRGRWIQNMRARTPSGRACMPEDTSAACWCLYGAIERVAPRCDLRLYRSVYEALCPVVGSSPIDWNDTRGRTQAEVVAALRAAAEKARAAA